MSWQSPQIFCDIFSDFQKFLQIFQNFAPNFFKKLTTFFSKLSIIFAPFYYFFFFTEGRKIFQNFHWMSSQLLWSFCKIFFKISKNLFRCFQNLRKTFPEELSIFFSKLFTKCAKHYHFFKDLEKILLNSFKMFIKCLSNNLISVKFSQKFPKSSDFPEFSPEFS